MTVDPSALVVAALANLGVLAVMFVPLERAYVARRQRVLRPELGLDLCFFFGQYLLFAPLAALAVAYALPSWPIVSTWPLWLQALVAIIPGDVAVYWFHRACHRFDVLWRFHRIHHTSRHLDWLAAHREHPLDGLFTQLCMNLPAAALGARLDLLAGLAVFRGVWAIMVHANARLPLGPLRWLLGASELHHWHHACVERTAHNFANLAPYLDLIFGTYRRPASNTYAFGVHGEAPRGYLAMLLAPFRRRVTAR